MKREFLKTPKKSKDSFWKKILRWFRSFEEMGLHANFGGHHDRMQRRRRKTRFDK